MTPQERQLIDDLFDRLARLEGQPRDPQAQQAIEAGLSRAPNALYPLVQTVLVQDEALKRAQARLAELGDGAPQQEPGFLDSMRSLLTGQPSRGSVPSVRPGFGGDPRSATPNPAFGQGGGSFLGTAAATAAGVVGGAMIGHMLGGLFGGSSARAAAFDQSSSSSPWDRGNADSSLARDAGIDDVGGSDARSAGLFGDSNDNGDDGSDNGDDFDASGDFDGDVGGDFGDDAA